MIERIVLGPLHTNTYIVATGKKECIIIDPGPDGDTICKNLDMINMVPHTIVFTHGHIDHTSGSRTIQKYFAERGLHVKVGIHEKDAPYLADDATQLNRGFLPQNNSKAQEAFDMMFRALPEPDFVMNEHDSVPGSGLKVIHTPGHTPGSICFYDEEKESLFTGDTLFFDGIGHSFIPEGKEDHLLTSINEKLLVLPSATRIFPGHGPYTTIEREQRDNQYKTNHGMI